MEIHKDKLFGIEKFKPNLSDGTNVYFEKALIFTKEFYNDDFERILNTKFENLTPELFYQEHMWVTHATGFSAKAVGKFMPRLLEAYGPYNVLGNENFDVAFERIKLVCNNRQKAKAVHKISKILISSDWSEFKNTLSPVENLAKLPYIGKVTCYHLGRNIGLLDCVKPDLHLVRMAEHWGFSSCEEMCKSIHKNYSNIPLGLIDYVLWLNASTFGTIEIKTEGSR